MEPSSLAPRAPKPAAWWVLITFAAGALGSLAAIAAGGKGTYDIAPFKVELRAWPALQGKTELAYSSSLLGGTQPGLEPLPRIHAEAGTHRSPIVFRATIVDVTSPGSLAASDTAALKDPYDLAKKLADDGKDARTAFGLKLAALAASGAIAAGVLVSLSGLRWRRVAGALLAGVLTFAVIGLLVQGSYDTAEFSKTRFVSEDSKGQPITLPNL